MAEALAGLRETSRKRISARMLTILLLLDSPDARGTRGAPIVGTTRLQKLAFLVQERVGKDLKKAGYFKFDFEYEPEKFGPADLNLYQDIEYLKAMKLISEGGTSRFKESIVANPDYQALILDGAEPSNGLMSEASAELDQEETELSFDYLMGVDSEELLHFRAGHRRETVYTITDRAKSVLKRIRRQTPERDAARLGDLVEACRAIKSKFGSWPLQRLLRSVYRDYPSMISQSVIRDRVLGADRSR